MKWVTRERVKVDRVACPWLIRKFIDPEAESTSTAEKWSAGVSQTASSVDADASSLKILAP
jgi:hypothetical protein